MNSKIVEVQGAGSGNWGAFQLWQFRDEDIHYQSRVHPETTVWGAVKPPSSRDLVIWDLRTKEGAMFDLSSDLVPQLYRHQIHVCVLFEPFLVWLDTFLRSATFRAIPEVVTLAADACPPHRGAWLAPRRLAGAGARGSTRFHREALDCRRSPTPATVLGALHKAPIPTVSPQTSGNDVEGQILRGRGAERTCLGELLRQAAKDPHAG